MLKIETDLSEEEVSRSRHGWPVRTALVTVAATRVTATPFHDGGKVQTAFKIPILKNASINRNRFLYCVCISHVLQRDQSPAGSALLELMPASNTHFCIINISVKMSPPPASQK